MASALRLAAPLGILRLLLHLDAFPLCPSSAVTATRSAPRTTVDGSQASAGPSRDPRRVASCDRCCGGGGRPTSRPTWDGLWRRRPAVGRARQPRGGAEVGGHAARAGHPIKERGVRPTDDTWHNIHMSHVGLTVEAIRATVQAALARTGTSLSSVPVSKGPRTKEEREPPAGCRRIRSAGGASGRRPPTPSGSRGRLRPPPSQS